MVMDIFSIMSANSRMVMAPAYLRWLQRNGDATQLPTEPDSAIRERIIQLMTEPPRKRSGSFSASSAGQCERAQSFGFIGAPSEPIDVQLRAIFEDGKWRHLRMQAVLLQAGAIHDIEVPQFWRGKLQRGTMDGQGTVPLTHGVKAWRGREIGLEVKGVSAFLYEGFKKEGPKEEHLNQIHRYFLMSGLDLFSLLYENKSTQEVHEWIIEPDPKRMEAQREEVEALYEAATSRELPQMLPECKLGKGAWKRCGFGGKDGICGRVSTWQEAEDYDEE